MFWFTFEFGGFVFTFTFAVLSFCRNQKSIAPKHGFYRVRWRRRRYVRGFCARPHSLLSSRNDNALALRFVIRACGSYCRLAANDGLLAKVRLVVGEAAVLARKGGELWLVVFNKGGTILRAKFDDVFGILEAAFRTMFHSLITCGEG